MNRSEALIELARLGVPRVRYSVDIADLLTARDDGVISSYEMLLRAFARAHCLDREPIRPLGQDELDRLTDRIAKALEALEIAEKWPK